ncbi:hypothetical protein RSOLAG22IIIB_04849 [Rhizoctonia solani]|uniref:SUR7/PalI family-domain-containing protein n=1 Tax=Rhizoctonia solani TaxID=456999 RepID=A0A0K6G0E5_9AGAM|nr:hypothetical protein RSOLAG22IIIB_04849 [Rhizoctonia solani]
MGLGFIVPCLVFLGFTLLLLVSLSTPIIKTISILSIKGGDFWATFIGPIISGDIEFGVWGYCISEAKALFLGFNVWKTKHCTRIGLGYEVDNRLFNFLGLANHKNTITYALMFVLGLHPIACGLALLAFVFTLILRLPCRPPHLITTLAWIFLTLSTIATTISLATDVTIISGARYKASTVTDAKVEISYGNVLWIMCGATIALWTATFGTHYDASVRNRRAEVEQGPSQPQKKE